MKRRTYTKTWIFLSFLRLCSKLACCKLDTTAISIASVPFKKSVIIIAIARSKKNMLQVKQSYTFICRTMILRL